MNTFFYFLIWAVIIFVMMRFGGGVHGVGHSHGNTSPKEPRKSGGLLWISPTMDIDPVFGKTVSTSAAKPSVHDGNVYYFCSREYREIFEAAPEQYVRSGAKTPPPQLENRHV
jgi:YHS domain-containing protein